MKNIPTWMIVMIGLVFNISAALVTHFVIEKKNDELSRLNTSAMSNNNEIGLLWGQIEAIEQKRDTLLILTQQGEVSAVIAPVISSIFFSHLHQQLTIEELNDFSFVNDKINIYQQQVREQIDQRFLANLEYLEIESQYKKTISSLRNWSIFLQMIGLSLILARDLSRKN